MAVAVPAVPFTAAGGIAWPAFHSPAVTPQQMTAPVLA
jgi:hypothetical protein